MSSDQIDQINAAKERLSASALDRKKTSAIHGALEDAETVHEIIVGVADHSSLTSNGTQPPVSDADQEIAVLTSTRILLLDAKGTESWIEHESLYRIALDPGVSISTISFVTEGHTHTIDRVPAADARRFCEVAARRLNLEVLFGDETTETDEIEAELRRLKGLLAAGLITRGEYDTMRKELLQRLGYTEDEDDEKQKSIVPILALILASVTALVVAFMLFSSDDEDEDEPAEDPTQTAEGEESPEPEDETSPEEEQTPEEEEAGQEEAEPTPEETETVTEEPEEDTSTPEEEEADDPADQYDVGARDDMQEAIQQFVDDQDLEGLSIQNFDFSDAEISVFLSDHQDSDQASAADLSADLAELIAEDNDIFDEPVHDAEVTASYQEDEDFLSVVTTYDRDANQYSQSTEG